MNENDIRGIAVVIDDEINDEDSNVFKLVEEIKKKKIPCVTYDSLPELDVISHFSQVPFIILDWQLYDLEEEGVQLPDSFVESEMKRSLEFIKKVQDDCFCPIFIFTNTDVSEVSARLKKEDLLRDDSVDMIFVKNKDELLDENLFKEIVNWVRNNSTIYTLLKWEKVYEGAKNQLFSDFYKLSRSWPKVLWDTYSDDGVNASDELGGMITRNLHSRMTPFSFNEDVYKKGSQVCKKELRSVLQGEKFVKRLSEDSIRAGDVFKLGNSKKPKYYINVRPDCDCISRNGEDDVNLYLLRMSDLSNVQEQNHFQKEFGNFTERTNESVIFNMFKSKTFTIKFKSVEIMAWSEIKERRVGRLIPPHITRVLQRYSFYLQREGMPRIPKEAVIDEVKNKQ